MNCFVDTDMLNDMVPEHTAQQEGIKKSTISFVGLRLCNPSRERSSESSSSSPGRRRPLLRPGGTVLRPFVLEPGVLPSAISTIGSSSPPGQNGTYPDFPRTNVLLGAGARSKDVDVRPLDGRIFGVCNNVGFQHIEQLDDLGVLPQRSQ